MGRCGDRAACATAVPFFHPSARRGRILVVFLGACVYCLAAGLQAGAQNQAMLYAGRACVGIGMAFGNQAAPVRIPADGGAPPGVTCLLVLAGGCQCRCQRALPRTRGCLHSTCRAGVDERGGAAAHPRRPGVLLPAGGGAGCARCRAAWRLGEHWQQAPALRAWLPRRRPRRLRANVATCTVRVWREATFRPSRQSSPTHAGILSANLTNYGTGKLADGWRISLGVFAGATLLVALWCARARARCSQQGPPASRLLRRRPERALGGRHPTAAASSPPPPGRRARPGMQVSLPARLPRQLHRAQAGGQGPPRPGGEPATSRAARHPTPWLAQQGGGRLVGGRRPVALVRPRDHALPGRPAEPRSRRPAPPLLHCSACAAAGTWMRSGRTSWRRRRRVPERAGACPGCIGCARGGAGRSGAGRRPGRLAACRARRCRRQPHPTPSLPPRRRAPTPRSAR